MPNTFDRHRASRAPQDNLIRTRQGFLRSWSLKHGALDAPGRPVDSPPLRCRHAGLLTVSTLSPCPVIIRPVASIVGIICEKYDVLCESEGFNFHFANVYLEAIDFISISIALYGLFLFYALVKDELVGRRPLAKFLAIKLIVMATFYQAFVFKFLEGKVIHETPYWTTTNIANGLNAFAICIEMVFFSLLMMWAYSAKEYKKAGQGSTSVWQPLWDSINFSDFAVEIAGSFRYFFQRMRGTQLPPTRRHAHKVDFGEAFGVGTSRSSYLKPQHQMVADGSEENIRLSPYSYAGAGTSASASASMAHLDPQSPVSPDTARPYDYRR
ncbi:hypothetical protein HGRIS_010936 [Hohenbuehelia grisea]|uniref:Uncharacterized protein n=1 Tax=Hohenbuehelia grisea TaxID=104357 RepID=A0ABR3IYA5_9AGAR